MTTAYLGRAHGRHGSTGASFPLGTDQRGGKRRAVRHYDVTQYGRVRGIVQQVGHHGERKVQVHRYFTAPQEQVSDSTGVDEGN